MSYIEYDFRIDPRDPFTEILLAELSLLEFESFVETELGLKAYIRKDLFKPGILKGLTILQQAKCEIQIERREIEEENWNAKWERNFRPILIDDRCTVRASFHDRPHTEYDIVIDPKMSFGTGHHETTHLMIKMMLDMDLKGKTVLDMGCGTGVLAIFAQKKGAVNITAIDIDAWSYENCLENIERNDCRGIEVLHGDIDMLEGKVFDVIIANINRNVLMEHLPGYAEMLCPDGVLMLSGFYSEDIPVIETRCKESGLSLSKKLNRNNWVALKFLN